MTEEGPRQTEVPEHSTLLTFSVQSMYVLYVFKNKIKSKENK